jgi:O-antigen/teichoic acid export membrane protein
MTGRMSLRSGGQAASAARVSVGLLVLSLSSYVFLTLSARAMPAASFSTVAVLWSLLFALATGAFYPVEQTLTRELSLARSTGLGWHSALGTPLLAAGAILLVLLAVVWVVVALAGRAIFSGQAGMGLLLAAGLAATAGLYVVRGIFAGTSRLHWYGAQLGGEGVLRSAGALVLWAIGVSTPQWYGAVLAGAAALTLLWSAAVAMLGPVHPVADAVAAPELVRPGGTGTGGAAGALGWLLLATVLSQALVNIGPVVLAGRPDTTAAAAGQFLAMYVLVRIPLLFTSVVQASLVPPFVDALVRADLPAYRRSWRHAVLVVGGLGVLAVVGVALVGPQVLTLFFGPQYEASRLVMVVLTFSSSALLLASVYQAALVALGRQRRVAVVWVIAAVVFALTLLLPLGGIAVVTLATTTSAVVAVVGLGLTTADPGPALAGALARSDSVERP